jgi:hypothetical protein
MAKLICNTEKEQRRNMPPVCTLNDRKWVRLSKLCGSRHRRSCLCSPNPNDEPGVGSGTRERDTGSRTCSVSQDRDCEFALGQPHSFCRRCPTSQHCPFCSNITGLHLLLHTRYQYRIVWRGYHVLGGMGGRPWPVG